MLQGISLVKTTPAVLTYLYKDLVNVNCVLGAGFHEDGVDGISVVLGILLRDLSVEGSENSVNEAQSLYTTAANLNPHPRGATGSARFLCPI